MRIVWLCVWMALVTSSATAQECVRDSIGLDPVQPTLTLPQWNAGLTAASQIVKRLPNGQPSSNGRIVFLGVGMSNTVHVFKAFISARKQANLITPGVDVISGGVSGAAAAEWANPNCSCWTKLLTTLSNLGLTPVQVGAVFLMVTNKFPTGTPEANAALFVTHVQAIRSHLTTKGFVNRKIDYLAGNYYVGCGDPAQTPEPYSYYENLTLTSLAAMPSPVFANPVPGWRWNDGARPRFDGLTMLRTDYEDDLIHLSTAGRQKHGRNLLDAFRADPTTYGWLW